MKPLIILLAMALAGCANEAAIQSPPAAVTIKVPVGVSCVDAIPPAPSLLTDAQIKAMPDYLATATLIQERIEREIYEEQLNAVLDGCK